MSVPKIVVHTDVFLGHLVAVRQPSVLRQAMGKFFCYATVFHAIELFSLAKSKQEEKSIEDAMSAMKVLGLNPKNARGYGKLLAGATGVTRWNMLIAGLCLESRLPILTDRRQDFRGIRGLLVIPTALIARFESASEILVAVQRQGPLLSQRRKYRHVSGPLAEP